MVASLGDISVLPAKFAKMVSSPAPKGVGTHHEASLETSQLILLLTKNRVWPVVSPTFLLGGVTARLAWEVEKLRVSPFTVPMALDPTAQ